MTAFIIVGMLQLKVRSFFIQVMSLRNRFLLFTICSIAVSPSKGMKCYWRSTWRKNWLLVFCSSTYLAHCWPLANISWDLCISWFLEFLKETSFLIFFHKTSTILIIRSDSSSFTHTVVFRASFCLLSQGLFIASERLGERNERSMSGGCPQQRDLLWRRESLWGWLLRRTDKNS